MKLIACSLVLHTVLLSSLLQVCVCQLPSAVFDSPPLGYTVSEGVGQTTVCVQVTGIVQTDITIAAHTEFFFSAVSGEDYVEANLTFSFTPLSSLTDCTTVTLLEDTVVEGVEFFGLQLEGNPDIVFPTPRAFINIIDNDNVELLFDQLPYSAVEDSSAVVCVLFTSTPGQLITTNIGVTFAFTDGTASSTEGMQDYLPISASRSLFAPSVPQCVSVPLLNDPLIEPPEDFTVMVSSPNANSIQTTVQIIDNDGVTLSLVDTQLTVVEGASGATTLVQVCVSLVTIPSPPLRDIHLSLTTGPVTADESDFVPLNGQLCVVPGSTPAGVPVCCPITVLGDDVIENNEAFVVVVNPSDPGDVIVGSDTVAIVITDDNDFIADCGPLFDPANGGVLLASTLQGSTADYSCVLGYMVEGVNPRVCLESGQWSGMEPECTLVDCGSLPPPAEGQVTFTLTTFGSTATYTCTIGFNLVGDESRTCQANGDWSGSAPTCQIVECAVLNDPLNGDVTLTGTTFGSTASYTCADGYVLTGGSSFRVCRPSGLWSSSAPTCIPVDCGPLSNPVNGQVELNGTSFMATASYSCSAGFGLEGEASRMCLASRLWSGSEPQCTVDCGVLSDPANGSVVHSSTLAGSSASYTCDEGFAMVGGTGTRTCGSDGTWTGMEPDCQIRDCGGLLDPANGTVSLTGSTVVGSEADYSCLEGFSLSGDALRTCLTSGLWSGQEPQCIIVSCDLLAPPPDGTLETTGRVFGSHASYTCDEGFTLQGDMERECDSSGTWTGVAPICLEVDCGALQPPINGTLLISTTVFMSEAVYQCDPGFTASASLLIPRQCQANGTWSGENIMCLPVDCGDLPHPLNGNVSVSPDTTLGGVASYTCDTGYNVTSPSSRTCTAEGAWSENPPTCQPVDCGQLLNPAGGAVTLAATTLHSVAEYSCSLGHTLSGPTSRSCLPSGVWSGEEPHCLIVDCGPLPAPGNGSVHAPVSTFSQSASYQCDHGFTLVGGAERTCLASANWSGSAPTCQIVDCGPLLAPAFAAVLLPGGTVFSSTAEYICDVGFALEGNQFRFCMESGEWNGTEPVCEEITCPPLQDPTEGEVLFQGTGFGVEALYSCNTGFNLTGDVSRRCQANREWTGMEPTCIIVDCGALLDPENGMVTFSQSVFQSIAEYECDTGYTLEAGAASRTCGEGGVWSGAQPLCSLIDCGPLPGPLNGAVSHNDTTFQAEASYSCSSGYSLSGGPVTRSCQASGSWSSAAPLCDDINECLLGDNGGCNQTCENTPGSFTCRCGEGFLLSSDGFLCEDIDECAGEQHGCDQFCANTIGSFECGCAAGYTLGEDGTSCNNINECLEGSSGCDTNADCVDTQGSSTCTCREGFVGTGFLCERQCTTMFQLLLSGVGNCAVWRFDDAPAKLSAIRGVVLSQSNAACGCDLPVEHIFDAEFSCATPDDDEVLYRAVLRGNQASDCPALLSHISTWVESQAASVIVLGNRLFVAPNCEVEIDSFLEGLVCLEPPTVVTTEALATPGAAMPLAAVAGGTVAGLLIAGGLVIIILVIICVSIRNHKRSKRLDLPTRYHESTTVDHDYQTLENRNAAFALGRRPLPPANFYNFTRSPSQEQHATTTLYPGADIAPTSKLSDVERTKALLAGVGKAAKKENGVEGFYDDAVEVEDHEFEEVYDNLGKREGSDAGDSFAEGSDAEDSYAEDSYAGDSDAERGEIDSYSGSGESTKEPPENPLYEKIIFKR